MKKTDYAKIAPRAMKLLIDMEKFIHEKSDVDPKIRELVKIRVSQINGCAFCLNMHSEDALKKGETVQRILLLNAWRETSLFSEKEKVALELAERVTLIKDHHVDEALQKRIEKHFSDQQFVGLLFIITQINTWNRLNIAVNNDIA